ncbi:MAG: alkaline phosphatase family protein [Actinomycetota bacterium]
MTQSSAPPRSSPPRIPDYLGGCVSNIIPAILGPKGTADIPGWMPSAVRGAHQVVLLVADGLGWNQLQGRAAVCPTLMSMSGGSITTVAPTTTVSALTSITTGLTPGEHGLVGYRMDMGGRVMQMLRWGDEKGDLRRMYPPDVIQPCPPFMGAVVPVLSKAELEGSAFTEAHLRGVRACGWRSSSSIAVQVRALLQQRHSFIYVYYDGIDKIAHERGFGEYYDAELRLTDRLVADIASVLVPGSVLLVTADHGQVDVGTNTSTPHPDVRALTTYQSGEGRFRWLHTRSGTVDELWSAAQEHHGHEAWVMRRDELIDGGWFGSRVSDAARQRLGDVALIAHAPTSFDDPADSGPFPLICRHGSLTDDELDVPLLAMTAGN